MDIRDIAVIIDLNGERRAAIAACELARRLGAHLTGLSLAYDPVVPGYAVAPVPADFMISAREQAITEAKDAVTAFRRIAASTQVAVDARTVDIMAGGGLDGVVREVRFADLVVIGDDDPDRPEPVREALVEALLFRSGAPVLLVPHHGMATIEPNRITIAWDDSLIAARAVRTALSFLKLAGNVEIVIVDDGRDHGEAPASQVCAHLARHGIAATVRHVPIIGHDASAAIRKAAEENGSGLIVMGGYGHSRLKEWILGGTTRGMLDHMSMPVLMGR